MNVLKSETVRYLIFGVLATAVYALVKWLTWQAWHSGWGSETAAQASSIIFAFSRINFFVFKHQSTNLLRDFINLLLAGLFSCSFLFLLTGGLLTNIQIF